MTPADLDLSCRIVILQTECGVKNLLKGELEKNRSYRAPINDLGEEILQGRSIYSTALGYGRLEFFETDDECWSIGNLYATLYVSVLAMDTSSTLPREGRLCSYGTVSGCRGNIQPSPTSSPLRMPPSTSSASTASTRSPPYSTSMQFIRASGRRTLGWSESSMRGAGSWCRGLCC